MATSPFSPQALSGFSDVRFLGSDLHSLMVKHSENGKLDLVTQGGNRVIFDGEGSERSMRKVRVLFNGKNSTIRIGGLGAIGRLDLASVSGGNIDIAAGSNVRGATIFSSTGSEILMGADCLLSSDIMIYASGAHGIYNAIDGERRGKRSIEIGNHVWIGQGARILAGTVVGEGAVIGSYSVLAGRIPNNAAAAGNPCRVTTRDIFWVSETVEGNYYAHLARTGCHARRFA